MKLISERKFLRWVAEREIGPDERYSDQRFLVFRPYRDHNRFWTRPETITDTQTFVGHLLRSIEPWSYCRAWPRASHWPLENDPKPPEYASLLDQAGIPWGQVGALHFTTDEQIQLELLLSAQLYFGWNVDDDVFVVPDNGDYLLMVDHHDVVWVDFRRELLIADTVRKLEMSGYPLPSEAPDSTFKPQEWLEGP